MGTTPFRHFWELWYCYKCEQPRFHFVNKLVIGCYLTCVMCSTSNLEPNDINNGENIEDYINRKAKEMEILQ